VTIADPAWLAERLRAQASVERARALQELAQLSAIDAPTGDPEALREPEQLLAGYLAEIGGELRRHPSALGTHLEARLGKGDAEPILVLGHYDTVWPRGTVAVRPFTLENGIARGPGVLDMRGGLVVALGAIRALNDLGALRRPVIVLFTADEESGSVESERLILSLGGRVSAALVLEAPLPGGALKTARKGVVGYRLEVSGRQAHAGHEPERGVSAVSELLDLLRDVEAFAHPEMGTTVNVGLLGGGSAPNVVAGSAFAEVDVRVATLEEYERIEAAFSVLRPVRAGAEVTVTRTHGRPPMERTAAIAEAAGRARELAALLGIELGEGETGGGSDGNLLAPLGIAVVDGVGPEGEGAHAPHEHIVLRSLEERIALVALLIALL
jgi:glutamate carboxypeptidase